jgi:hypothetical protein
MTNESELLKKIQVKLSPQTILFRNNVGTGWIGTVKRSKTGSGIYIENSRPLNAGLCVGSSDLIGWKSIEITPDMVGKKIAVFVAIEGKTGKLNPTPEQLNFIEQLKKAGGIAGVARSVDDAFLVVNEKK